MYRSFLVATIASLAVMFTACSSSSETASPSASTAQSPPQSSSDPVAPTSSATPNPEKPSPVVTRASILKKNKLYKAKKLKSGKCAAQSDIPLDSVANLQSYYDSVLKCLNSTWKSLGGKAYKYKPAKLVMHSGEKVSSCDARSISYYCASENTIYMYADEIIDPWHEFEGNDIAHRNIRLSAAHTIAHEYGHHVQNLAKMFTVFGNAYGTLDENRLELQASCLGEAFLGANDSIYPITSDDLANAQYWRYIAVPHHGSVANQKYWGDRGLATRKPGSCNTWTAPKGKVA